MEHLIANSGIHFLTTEIEFNPADPLLLRNGRMLKYSFSEAVDPIDGTTTFSILYDAGGIYIPVEELLEDRDALNCTAGGNEIIDESGMISMKNGYNTVMFTTYGGNDVYSISSLESFRVAVNDPHAGHQLVSAFNLLLDKWLPMPMFKNEVNGDTSSFPIGWCRMKMQKIGVGTKKGSERFRLTWAFDTQLTDDLLNPLRPYSDDLGRDGAVFSMCNRAEQLIGFLSSDDGFHAFSDYIASLLNINPAAGSRKYKAYYIYFLNFIRLSGGAPMITLHRTFKPESEIAVDLVLDIGNSRTCGILFEEGSFTKGMMMELRDLSMPWICYENSAFDMRVVFRKADFGNDMLPGEDLFTWKSFVRIGEEAKRLIYRSIDNAGLAAKTTNYSSPKRYLWDKKEFEGQWESLVTVTDALNVNHTNDIYIPGLSELFENDGSYNPGMEDDIIMLDGVDHKYSRSSLMTFAFIEIFQQAMLQINSVRYRNKWGKVDCRRYIRNVIITCPTAMPLKEQVFLRQSATDAYDALTRCLLDIRKAEIIPSAHAVGITDPNSAGRTWAYDEASCCQMVYLCAEIKQRYGGDTRKFFELKGHVRPELADDGYNDKALTVGTIDIGAGTTDIMVCAYEYAGGGQGVITPVPLFWDSFYLAGDDILRSMIQNIIIEGNDSGNPSMGSVSSALLARIIAMSDDELRSLPCLEDNAVYNNKVDDICAIEEKDLKVAEKIAFVSNLIHDFFGVDSAMMGYRDRRCRNDFNTQISLPIVQRMMELLRTHKPRRVYTYDELFGDLKPADYLLEHFEHHFGFRFEELSWCYDPLETARIVKATMEPLIKQLAAVLYAMHCDVIVLAGRPTSLDAVTELLVKYVPTSPDRLIRLNDYRVGSWFPTADGQGYFYDQKSIVAVGGMVAYLASHARLEGFAFDFSKMIKKMSSTANYIGEYNSRNQQVAQAILSPQSMTAMMTVNVFPVYLGCRQLDSRLYQARPLYAIYNHGNAANLRITLSRSYDNKEELVIEDATDTDFRDRKRDLELVQQSLVDDGKYWLDKGEFELTIR